MTIHAAPELATYPPDSGDMELVSMDSLMATHSGRWTFLILEGAAFMMQAMHPVIAEVTGRYSAAFNGDPAGRLVRSVDSVLRWVYGGAEAIAEGNRVRALHRPLTMTSRADGKQISALHPGAYQWVIATAYVTTATASPLLLGREFTPAEKEELLRDNLILTRLLHVPMKGYPQTAAEFDAYFEEMVTQLQATPQALELVQQLKTGQIDLPSSTPTFLRPAILFALRPFIKLNYLAIFGLLDPRLRDRLGITWSAREQRQLERAFAVVRLAYRVLPDRLTYFPLAYHARKHHQCIQKMQERQQGSYAYHLPSGDNGLRTTTG